MDATLTPLLVLVAVTAALIPVLLYLMLGREARPVATGPSAPRGTTAQPIWRAWVDEPAAGSAGGSAGPGRSPVRTGAHRPTP